MKNILGSFTRFVAQITRNALGMAGAVLTTVSAILLLGPFGAAVAVAVSSLPYLLPGPGRYLTRSVFNLGQLVLAALLAAVYVLYS